MFQEDGLWGPWCAEGCGGCSQLCFRCRLAKPGVCLGPQGLEHAMMASSRLHALTQQKHRSGAPSLVCQGLPSWPGPSQATCPAKLVLNICIAFPAPPNPTPATGPGHSGRLVSRWWDFLSLPLEPLTERSLGLPQPFHLLRPLLLGRTFQSLAGGTSVFLSNKWSSHTGCLMHPRLPPRESPRLVPSGGRNCQSEAGPPL